MVVIGQLDQTDHYIRGDERIRVFDAFLKSLVTGVGLAIELAEAFGVPVFLRPLLGAAQPQKITVVFEQFTQAGTGHAGELDFGFFGSARGLAAFENICFPDRAACTIWS